MANAWIRGQQEEPALYAALQVAEMLRRLSEFARDNGTLDSIVAPHRRWAERLSDSLWILRTLEGHPLRPQPIDMTSLARRAAGDEAAHAVVHPLASAMGERVLIGKVFAHLISNARTAIGDRPDGMIEVGFFTEHREQVYYVKDNGIGFDPRQAERLFLPFEKLHPATLFDGPGLGLAVVRKIIVRHGGRVWARGKPGQGATFYFSLPAVTARSTSARSRIPRSGAPRASAW